MSSIHPTAGIHPTAIVSDGAVLGANTTVGPYSIIGPRVVIGSENKIGPHVVIEGSTTVGDGNTIYQFASIGSPPQDLKYGGEDSTLEIGNNNIVREYVTIQPGTEHGGMRTIIGDKNLFMVSSHVAHDVRIGSHNVFANCAAVAGHVEVGDHVIVGGLVGIHQFVRIGDFVMISGGAKLVKDIPPYCIAQGDRAKLVGVNQIGLERAGVPEGVQQEIRKLFRLLFIRGGGFREKLEKLERDEGGYSQYVQTFLSFLRSSQRGIAPARMGGSEE